MGPGRVTTLLATLAAMTGYACNSGNQDACSVGAVMGAPCLPEDDGGDGSPSDICTAGTRACGAACVDLKSDAHHCGSCFRDCLGGGCSAGACQAVALYSGSSAPVGVAVDATNAYFTNSNAPEVDRVALAGGTATKLATTVATMFPGIAATSHAVYWTSSAGNTVQGAPDDGGAPWTIASSQNVPAGLAVDGASVYWASNADGAIRKAPLQGGSVVTTLAMGQAGPVSVAVDATNVYWTNDDGTVRSVGIGGGTPVTLASGQSHPQGIAVDSANVYWANATGGAVMRVAIGGGPPTTVASIATPTGVAVDSVNVYFTAGSHTDGALWKAPIAGGAPVSIATGQNTPGSIAIDSVSIVWTTAGGIMRIAK
jgi:hypothetical protein